MCDNVYYLYLVFCFMSARISMFDNHFWFLIILFMFLNISFKILAGQPTKKMILCLFDMVWK